MTTYHLGIDPSVKSVGWAMYTAGDGIIIQAHLNDLWNWQFGTLKTEGKTYEWQLVEIREFFRNTFSKFDVQTLVIEMPGFYNTETGRIAAKQGYTIGLGAVLGVVVGVLTIPPEAIYFYTAPAWKGSTPKWVTYKKLVRTFGETYTHAEPKIDLQHQHDTVDAIMLLHYHMIHNHNKK